MSRSSPPSPAAQPALPARHMLLTWSPSARLARPVRRLLLALLVLAPSWAMACNDYHHAELCFLGETQFSGEVSPEGIVLAEGQAVGMKVVPYREPEVTFSKDDAVNLVSDDPYVLGAARLDSHTEDCPGPAWADWYFVISAAHPGLTILRVYVNGAEREQIPVHVVAGGSDCL